MIKLYEKEEMFVNNIVAKGYEVVGGNRKRNILYLDIKKGNTTINFRVSDYIKLNVFVEAFEDYFKTYELLNEKRGK